VIAEEAARVLVPGGHLVLEVADGRGEEVAGLLAARGYEDVRASGDLAGRDRVVEGRWTR
jgi:methylase of polypeptide subunit release factors